MKPTIPSSLPATDLENIMNDNFDMDSGPMGWLWKMFPYIFVTGFVLIILYWIVVGVLVLMFGPHILHDAMKILDHLSN